ncbi:MAG TPA: HAD family hydrolase [Polyangiaceae bacterium]|nr:HAD family hydrolase [Polyangiaceae bacterium]
MGRRAVFLDRDGVLVRDVGPLTNADDIVLTPGVAEGLSQLAAAGFLLVVVSNQTVVARGLLNENAVMELQAQIQKRIANAGGPSLDDFLFCPHHPQATEPEYRRDCGCRKPAPGLLLEAALKHGISLKQSFMIGDRPSDVVAGHRAGCTTIQLTTGAHTAPPIEVTGGFDPRPPHHVVKDLLEAAAIVLGKALPRLGAAS